MKNTARQNRAKKGKENTPSDEPMVPSVHSVGVVGTLRNRSNEVDTVGWTTVQFLDASDELQIRRREDSSVGWTDSPLEGTVGLSDDQVQTRQKRAKIHAVAPDEPTGLQRFIRRSRRSYQRGFSRGVFSTGWSDDASEHTLQETI
jgi:hypothetical protein